MTNNQIQNAIIENIKWLDKVLWTGFSLGMIVIGLKILGYEKFEWETIEFKMEFAWIVFIILTIAHAYVTVLILQTVKELWSNSSYNDRLLVFNIVKASGGLFIRGLVPRINRSNFVKINIFEMSIFDPTVWSSSFAVIGLIVAIIPFKIIDLQYFIILIIVALLIAGLNWIIGSQWAIALSELVIDKNSSGYFQRLKTAFRTKIYFPISIILTGSSCGVFTIKDLRLAWPLLPLFIPIYISYIFTIIFLVLIFIVFSLIIYGVYLIIKFPFRIVSTLKEFINKIRMKRKK